MQVLDDRGWLPACLPDKIESRILRKVCVLRLTGLQAQTQINIDNNYFALIDQSVWSWNTGYEAHHMTSPAGVGEYRLEHLYSMALLIDTTTSVTLDQSWRSSSAVDSLGWKQKTIESWTSSWYSTCTSSNILPSRHSIHSTSRHLWKKKLHLTPTLITDTPFRKLLKHKNTHSNIQVTSLAGDRDNTLSTLIRTFVLFRDP